MGVTSERQYYRNAPIVEATIDIRVSNVQEDQWERLSEVSQILLEEYPDQETESVRSTQIVTQPDGEPELIEEPASRNGYRLTSSNGMQVSHVQRDGFAFSVLPPYDKWETFRDEARRLWQIYKEAVQPLSVTRIAMRYINHLDLASYSNSSETVKMEEYLNVYPELPVNWPGGPMMNFFMQTQHWMEDLKCQLVVNEAPVWHSQQEFALFQLDFDFFRELFTEPWEVTNDEHVWQYLEQLHARKNDVFESSITEATRRFIR